MKSFIVGSAVALSAFVATVPFAAYAQYGGGGGAAGGFGVFGLSAPNSKPNLSIATSGNADIAPPASTSTPQGQVLGAETYNFTKNLRHYMVDPEVVELQKFLIAEGYSIPEGVTDYFGPETFAAVKAFQTANKIFPSGLVGPQTRAALNLGIVSTTTEAVR